MNRAALMDEGIFAYAAGLGFLDNPYLETNIEAARHWIDGFVAALIAHRKAKKS